MGLCEFPLSAPGLLHLATLLIGVICAILGFTAHVNSSWVSNNRYRLCQETSEEVWKAMNVECPDISLEIAFLIIIVICITSSLLWYCCELCCLGHSKTGVLFYVIYLVLAAVALIIGGVLYIKSAVLIAQLPANYWPVVQNMGRVLYAAFRSEKVEEMKLTNQTSEQTYYQEKMATGFLTIIDGVLHIINAWLAVIDIK